MQLTLFFTRGNSLETWDKVGSLSREVAIYQALQKRDVDIDFITYGKNDLRYQQQLRDIQIHTNRFLANTRFYPRLIPLLHRSILFKTDVIKTNQMKGARFAIQAAKVFRKPIIVRQGYNWSHNVAKHLGDQHPKVNHIRQIERLVYLQASHIIVTSNTQHAQILQQLPNIGNKISILPNYVDTQSFYPQDKVKKFDLIAIGRLSDVKNTINLIQSVKELSTVTLLIIGDGELSSQLQNFIKEMPNRIKWIRRVPNSDLPIYYNQAHAFILPSHYEGMPKVLLEAMACGLPVIGTNVMGIREVIQHNINGWLSDGTDPQALKSAIQTVLANKDLQQRLGENARKTITSQYSLSHIADKEYELIREVAKNETVSS